MAIKIKRSTLNKIKKAAPMGFAALAVVIVLIVIGTKVVPDSATREARRQERVERREIRKQNKAAKTEQRDEPAEPKTIYGIEYEKYDLERGRIGNGQTLSHILGKYGVSIAMIDKIDRTARPVFNMRAMRAGQPYIAFMAGDSTARHLEYFVYEKNLTDFVVVHIAGDSVGVVDGQKEVTLIRRKEHAEIQSSMWNAIRANDLPAAMSMELEDIFGWSVDFFGLREGDDFTVIFDEKFIDTTRVGIGRIWGAEFHHGGKTYYAIPFGQDNKVTYWDENGKSLRKQLLKAPLKYSRISSKFSNARMHPILKIRRPHHGIDYAAPMGTPVVAIADGVITDKKWDKSGGGNILKIKHANNLTSGYLHLQGYAKGMAVGKRVSQGELIGYVGSTGRSTGPHLDFRLWKGTTPIDPLKAPSDSSEPISAENMPRFEVVKNKILAELAGDVPESEQITNADL